MNGPFFTDPSQNYVLQHPNALDHIFTPKNVAVIGAKDDPNTVGRTILANLIATPFSGKVWPINPKRKEVLGLPCYPSISSIPEPIDLAIIVTPAQTVPDLVAECADNKVKSCIIISAGFKELGEPGLKLEEEILYHARKVHMPIIGPNCLGVMNPIYGLNATFARGMALPGNLAFISQSGAMCTAVLDWSLKEKVGFSAFVSIGSMADVDWGDLIDYVGKDPNTRAILLYMETVGNPRKFLSAAREIALEKPIIVIKAGRSEQAAQAAASHTGSLAGSDAVFDAALERIGALRVNSIAELFQMASALSRQPRPKGPHLAIVTNAGGPGVLATDATISYGAELSTLTPQTLHDLDQILPPAWSHSNPIDILGDAGPGRYAKTLDVLEKDENCDGLLVILSPQDMTDPTSTAEIMRPYAALNKPILASWMGATSVERGIDILNHAGIPTFSYPDDAAKTFASMWRYSQNIQILYQTPQNGAQNGERADTEYKIQEAQEIIKQGDTLLDEFESKKVIAGYGIPIVPTEIAISEDEAVILARKMGFPIVLKLFSKTITHKSDVGGVKLNLKDEEQVRAAYQAIQKGVPPKHFQGVTVQKMVKLEGYELIIGSSVDPQFGPTILFGLGGQLVEVFKDSAIALPPLNFTLAKFLMEKTKVYNALKGVRGRKSVDLDLLADILVRFSKMITDNPRIKECDINPLIASAEGCVALDARIVLFEKSVTDLPKLAIRPYPSHYVHTIQLKNGEELTIRPIMPEDENRIITFHDKLSENSVRQRYFEFISLDERISHERLIRICFNDFDREIALVAENKRKEIVGVVRITKIPSTKSGQLTMIIIDAYHNLGLGRQLLQFAIETAKQEKLKQIYANILDENGGMLKLCQAAGFTLKESNQPHIIQAIYKGEKNGYHS